MKHDPRKQRVAREVRAATVAGALAAAFLVSRPAAAQEFGEPKPIESNVGPGVSVRPGAYFPSGAGAGFAVDANATIGIDAAPFVVAPGGRFAAYFGDKGAVSGMPIVEVMLPVGAFAPYVKAGIGVGHATGPGETSLALMSGGGLDLHVTRDVLLGVDATYETVTGTGFNTLSIGPRLGVRY